MSSIHDWFAQKGWTPFTFQEDVWSAMQRGESGMLHSSTGTGKTLAVWFGALLSSKRRGPGLRVLWLTPLRALAADTERALASSAKEAGWDWTVGRRTGDVKSSDRRKVLLRPPEALVTTPESLCLLLSRPDFLGHWAGLETVIVDEWHELLSSKRGVLVELALARLRAWNPELKVWGLSATLGNLTSATTCLGGYDAAGIPRPMTLVRGEMGKTIEIQTLVPPAEERIPWAGHLGLALAPLVAEEIQKSQTSIVFTNTRSQAELWYQALSPHFPAGAIALHHGSMDRQLRDDVEEGLRTGALRAVVATSSLDLGVDFSPVETVFQIGSPKGVARLLQRAGRSGHRPGIASRILCVPVHALEFVEIAAARELASTGRIEPREPLTGSLDVLCQHLLTVAAGTPFDENLMRTEVRSTHAFRNLSDAEWEWVLDFAARGGKTLHAYPDFHRLTRTAGRVAFASEPLAKRHRMGIGTISATAAIEVKFARGGSLGSVEESFIAKLRPGDTFLFAGRTLRLERVRDMRAIVRAATKPSRHAPQWMGGKMPLSSELAEGVREKLELAGSSKDPELQRIAALLDIQRERSLIPTREDFLMESLTTREGHHLFLYPFEGRAVHEGLAALLAYRLSQRAPRTLTFAVNDYGLELLSSESLFPLPSWEQWFSIDNLTADILASLNAAELSKRRFREIARIAGLTFEGFPGQRKSGRQLQISSGLLFDVFQKYDPENLLLRLAQTEVLNRELHASRLAMALQRLVTSRIILKTPPGPTPLAYPLLADRLRANLSSEELADRITRMEKEMEKR